MPETKVELIHNPVVSEEIFEKAKEHCPHPWINDKGLPVILGIGRISQQKDFQTLVRAFNEVNNVIPSRLLILGKSDSNDPETVNLIKLIKELNLEVKVAMPGFVQNPFAFLSRASLFVHPPDGKVCREC